MTEGERNGMFWELARGYLETVACDAERYAKLTRSERAQFWREGQGRGVSAPAVTSDRSSQRTP